MTKTNSFDEMVKKFSATKPEFNGTNDDVLVSCFCEENPFEKRMEMGNFFCELNAKSRTARRQYKVNL